MIRVQSLAIFAAVSLASTSALAGEAVNGTVRVIDGARMIIAGSQVQLADIAVPAPGKTCIMRNKTLDCGVLARAGLMDITAGAEVVCHSTTTETHRCTADGYDLSYGQLHAGWAVALQDAPVSYQQKMAEAKARKRGLWDAVATDGTEPFFSLPVQ